LGGDTSLGTAYDTPPDGGAALAAGGHYHGGLAAWKASFGRVKKAHSESSAGVPGCKNGCGQPRFGKYETCCTHCQGASGPHASGCKPKGYALCENGCGHAQFGKYATCCTRCTGEDGPHHRSCVPRREEKEVFSCAPCSAPPDTVKLCKNGCNRARFRHYKTCCTHCRGPGSNHAEDCDARAESGGGGGKVLAAGPQACYGAAPPRRGNRIVISFEGDPPSAAWVPREDEAADPSDTGGAGTLRVRIISAHMLMNKDSGFFGDVSDPLVRASLGSQEFDTPVIDNNLNPVWTGGNEFAFSVSPADKEVHLHVWNSNLVLPASSLGYLSMPFRDLGDGAWHPFRQNLVNGEDGELAVELKFEPLFRIFEQKKDLPGGWSHERFKEVMLRIGMSQEQVDEVIQSYDANSDGVIDMREFMAWLWGEETDDATRDQLKQG